MNLTEAPHPATATASPGLHHLTAIASSASENHRFYTEVLGLRLVKKTVNFDDPHTYHLYYGDEVGSPGTILTFFPWEDLSPGRAGAGSVTSLAFEIPEGSASWWTAHLARHDLRPEAEVRFGQKTLVFSDPDGLGLALVETPASQSQPWGQGTVPALHAIRRFHSATLSYRKVGEVAQLLQGPFGLEEAGQEGARTRYAFTSEGASGYLDLVMDPSLPPGRQGTGTVHHLALRARDDQHERELREHLTRFHPTPVIDRQYFHSVYFREPGGVLFEIATDQPGFSVDEPLEALGQSLLLPPQHEALRAQLERTLPRLDSCLTFRHRWEEAKHSTGRTLFAFHGTGGNENDLLPFVRQLDAQSAILSPRGKVLENGMPRFFRRLREGLFDEEDLIARTDELAAFLRQAAREYPVEGKRLAIGYSNGANIAASLLLQQPDTLDGAILLRAMLPREVASLPDLSGKTVLLLTGESDSLIPRASSLRLLELLEEAGAEVAHHDLPTGHSLVPEDLTLSKTWLQENA
ncbi:MAG: VOC family protein [Verrucomicrobiota bacterium]